LLEGDEDGQRLLAVERILGDAEPFRGADDDLLALFVPEAVREQGG
jgi:hypothetical protein